MVSGLTTQAFEATEQCTVAAIGVPGRIVVSARHRANPERTSYGTPPEDPFTLVGMGGGTPLFGLTSDAAGR